MTYPRPVLVATSVMVGIKALLAAAAVTDLIGAQATGIILAVILAVEMAVAKYYVESRVVPLAQTIAYADEYEQPRAGGAAGVTTNHTVKPDATIEELLEDEPDRGVPGL